MGAEESKTAQQTGEIEDQNADKLVSSNVSAGNKGANNEIELQTPTAGREKPKPALDQCDTYTYTWDTSPKPASVLKMPLESSGEQGKGLRRIAKAPKRSKVAPNLIKKAIKIVPNTAAPKTVRKSSNLAQEPGKKEIAPKPVKFSGMAALARRIIKETQRLQVEPVLGIVVQPFDDNVRHFDITIDGPTDSAYEGGKFKLELFLPEDYPMSPPKVIFTTRIYHPNIDKLGRICLDILKDKWSPALQIRTVLLSIQALLSAPNPDDPLANDVAEQWKTKEDQAIAQAKNWTKKYAV